MPRFVGAFLVFRRTLEECPDESGHGRLESPRHIGNRYRYIQQFPTAIFSRYAFSAASSNSSYSPHDSTSANSWALMRRTTSASDTRCSAAARDAEKSSLCESFSSMPDGGVRRVR